MYHQNNFSPILPNNQIFTQGYFNEITAFVNAIEKGENNILTDIAELKDTYEIINLSELKNKVGSKLHNSTDITERHRLLRAIEIEIFTQEKMRGKMPRTVTAL